MCPVPTGATEAKPPMKHSGAFGRENVKKRGVWLRKTLQRDILK